MRAATASVYRLPLLNVYGRYDNDIERMERVIPLFIRRIGSDEPITIYGPEKVLDFTYVDSGSLEGIVKGIYALNEGRVVNHTINLAYGQGNSLIKMTGLVSRRSARSPLSQLSRRRWAR